MVEHRVIVLPFAALVVLLTFSEVQGWIAPEFCHEYDCPEFEVVQHNKEEGFEERAYIKSQWITTNVPSSKHSDLMVGFSRLKDYCNKKNEAGLEITQTTWPALINITEENKKETDVVLSWFVPPGTKLPKPSNPAVIVESKPPATVYVRIFDGLPNHDLARDNVDRLRGDLARAGKSFEKHWYIAAGYENPINIFISHHNEIWIYALSEK